MGKTNWRAGALLLGAVVQCFACETAGSNDDTEAGAPEDAGFKTDANHDAHVTDAAGSSEDGAAADAASPMGKPDDAQADEQALDTLLVYGPPSRTPHATVEIRVRATAPEAQFRCALDQHAAEPCDATFVLEGLALGEHTLRVVAHVGANEDPEPLALHWTVASPHAEIASLCVGYEHACAVTASGELWCWGANASGQLGLGDTEPRSAPARVGSDVSWSLVTCGREHTCGVQAGEVHCWGNNESGQLGLGDQTDRFAPTDLGISDVRDIALGDFHSCLLAQDGKAACFGLNWVGRLGDGSETARTSPSAVTAQAGPYAELALGAAHSCALGEDQHLACWGANQQGQLGAPSSDACALVQGDVACAKTPQEIPDSRWRQVSAGNDFTCAIADDDALACWGFARGGVLGGAAATSGVTKVRVSGSWNEVSAGMLHACGVQTDDTLWCWGSNGNAQLGALALQSADTPVQTGFGLAWRAVAAGAFGSCALDTANVLWCWGQGAFAQSATPAWVDIEGGN